jgi:DNA polymerase I
MLDRRIESVFGWPLRLTTSPNQRTLYNFPMQSGGAEMLRLAAWEMCKAGLVPSMLVHDAVLFETFNTDEIEHVKEIMRKAGRTICDGFEIGVGEDQQLTNGQRYSDKRPIAKKMWATMMRALQEVGAIPPGELP